MKKRTGICTEETFWECVAEINWPTGEKSGMTKRECLIAWTMEFGISFRKIMETKQGEVYELYSEFERHELSESQRDKYYLGDDGYDDFCSHAVGCGQEIFEGEMADPMKLYKRACKSDYVECFSYCIPYEPSHPNATFDEFLEARKYPKTEKEWEGSYHSRDYDGYEDFSRMLKREYRHAQIGDWEMLETEHYAQWAEPNHSYISAFVAEIGIQGSRACDFVDEVLGRSPQRQNGRGAGRVCLRARGMVGALLHRQRHGRTKRKARRAASHDKPWSIRRRKSN